jgi:CMP-N,N'-diacetyllegionaminic acid synthase
MKILGIIPARGGSQGIPRKNIKPLAGKSLIQRSFICGTESGILDRIILSSDCSEIIEHAKTFGLEAPFVRPAEFAGNNSAQIDVVVHALRALAADGYHPDAVLLLQPTSPIRKPEHIQRAAELLKDNDSVCTVIPIPKDHCPHYVMKITKDGFLDYFLPDGVNYTRRQDVPQAYNRDGTIFLTRTQILLEDKSFYGTNCIPMPISIEESLNIDEPCDWSRAVKHLTNANCGNRP